jgi:hypothetical protein
MHNGGSWANAADGAFLSSVERLSPQPSEVELEHCRRALPNLCVVNVGPGDGAAQGLVSQRRTGKNGLAWEVALAMGQTVPLRRDSGGHGTPWSVYARSLDMAGLMASLEHVVFDKSAM